MAKKTTKTTPKKASPTPAPTLRKPAPVDPVVRQTPASAPKRRTVSLEPVVLSHKLIAQRAYQLWQQTGNPNESHNWSEAQRLLRAEQSRA